MTDADERWMSEALELAARGRGAVEPNPMVGAVIVREGRAVGRGWHRRFGGPHAEAEALADAISAGADVRSATMYVTLEPCRGFPGKKTPPCSEAIVAAGLARVVVAMGDPDAHVAGRGLAALRDAGLDVRCGVLEARARKLLSAYVKLRTRGRPWVIGKWAQTADGYLALPAGAGRWVSCEESRAEVHRLRGLCDGICVGIGTVLADDPLLTNRGGAGRQPVRVVLDARLRTPPGCRLLKTLDVSPVIVATASPASRRAEALRKAGAELLELPGGEAGIDPGALLDELGRRQWTNLLIEGGAKVLRSFVLGRLADELVVFVSGDTVAEGGDLPRFDIAEVRAELSLGPCEEERRLGRDTMMRWIIEKEPGSLTLLR